MKKLLLFVICALTLSVNAQIIDVIREELPFSMISPNGNYLAGNMEDYVVYYNVATKTNEMLEGDVLDDGGCYVWDINNKGQLAVDWKNQAAIWSEADKFVVLPRPDGLSKTEKAYSAARCISEDGKYIVVSFASPAKSIWLYTLGEDGEYTMDKLALPEVAPIYNQTAQFVAPCAITEDGNRILARFVVETAEFELPFVWELTPGGDWMIRWIALDFIVEGGETAAEFYGTEVDFDGDPLMEPEAFEAAQNEWLQKREEYYAIIDAVSSGYFYAGEKGDLSDMEMSANGKYIKMNISYKDLQSEDTTIYNYPAVIDFETEEVYVFTCVDNAGCLSVTDEGLVSLATPKVEYFRYAFVSSIEDPTKAQTLTEWAKEKTEGKIDLAKYMTYTDNNGQKLMADGSAYLFSDGSGFMTNQYNGFGSNSSYETFVVRFDDETATEIVNDGTFVVYPNPTNGVLNFAEALENVEIFDLLGRKVYTLAVAESSIDLGKLVSGTYFLVADKQGVRVSTKVIVK